jgi:hypothetical protein
VEVVHFTFPENLALYWEMTAQTQWLVAALLFLLIEERAVEAARGAWTSRRWCWSSRWSVLQYLYALMFLVAYVLVVFLLRGERPSLRRLSLTIVAPAALAIGIFGVQLVLAKVDPDVQLRGSRFLYRTGLDGDRELYGDHLDIAFGRDFIRAQRPGNREYFFRWPILFVSGVLAMIAALVAYPWGASADSHRRAAQPSRRVRRSRRTLQPARRAAPLFLRSRARPAADPGAVRAYARAGRSACGPHRSHPADHAFRIGVGGVPSGAGVRALLSALSVADFAPARSTCW